MNKWAKCKRERRERESERKSERVFGCACDTESESESEQVYEGKISLEKLGSCYCCWLCANIMHLFVPLTVSKTSKKRFICAFMLLNYIFPRRFAYFALLFLVVVVVDVVVVVVGSVALFPAFSHCRFPLHSDF